MSIPFPGCRGGQFRPHGLLLLVALLVSFVLASCTDENNPPVADAGEDQTARLDSIVTLDGSGSTDADGDRLSYQWAFVQRPAASKAVLSDATSIRPSFTMDAPGQYRVELVVSDELLNSSPDGVRIDTLNSAPVADAGPDQTVSPGTVVLLDGSGSSDPDDDSLTFSWALLERPEGSSAELSNPLVIFPAFTADQPGTYRVRLVVSDGRQDSTADHVIVSTVNSAPVADAGLDQAALLDEIVTLDGSNSGDADGDALGFSWSLLSQPEGSSTTLSNTETPSPSFVADAEGLFVAQLIVNDGQLDSEPDTSTVEVSVPGVVNVPPVIDSTPVTTATVGEAYSYVVNATDADGDSVSYSLSVAPDGMSIGSVSGVISWTPDAPGNIVVTVGANDGQGGSDSQTFTIEVQEADGGGPDPGTGNLPSDPAGLAKPNDPGVATLFANSIEFLYAGDNPIQTGVVDGSLAPERVSVVRGIVATREGDPLPGVTVSVNNSPELGQTLSRADGGYDIVVNGGGPVVIQFAAEGYLTAQRTVKMPWNDYRVLDPVRLVRLSDKLTIVDLSPTEASVARGEVETDSDGTRQGTLVFQPGTSASMVMPDGSSQPLNTLGVRVTEYTVGPNGPEAMPAALPPTTGYTYAAELSVDEAIAAGALRVDFDPAVIFYLENFIDFPVGTRVPLGSYNRQAGYWEASPDGLVVEIVGETDGLADVDFDGDGLADDPAVIGMTEAERQRLAETYETGQRLWRVEIPHFSPWDCNWPFGPPPGAGPPRPEHGPSKRVGAPPGDECPDYGFSRIDCQSQVLRETIPLAGTDQALHYRSDRADGYLAGRVLDIFIPAEEIPDIATRVRIDLEVAGTRETLRFPASDDVSASLEWDSRDAYGRVVYGPQPYTLTISFVYAASYSSSAAGGSGGGGGTGGSVGFFGQPGVEIVGSLAREEILLQRVYPGILDGPHPGHAGIGEWTLTDHHAYAPTDSAHFFGNGAVQRESNGIQNLIVRDLESGRDFGGTETSSVPLPDGSVLVGVNPQRGFGFGEVYKVEPNGNTSRIAGWNSAGAIVGDGPNAQFRRLDSAPFELTVLADGSFLIGQRGGIRRVDQDGNLTTISGQGDIDSALDLDYVGPAAALGWNLVREIAAGSDGSYYVAANDEPGSLLSTIWHVTPEGTAQRIAGTLENDEVRPGDRALDKGISVSDLAVNGEGDVLFTDKRNHRLWRIRGGLLEPVIGSGQCSGDWMAEGPALGTEMCSPESVAVSDEGDIFVASAFDCGPSLGCDLNGYTQRIYRYDGADVTIIAGGFNVGGYEPNGYALGNRMGNFAGDLHVMPDGRLLYKTVTGIEDIYLIEPVFSTLEATRSVPSSDGRYLYQFSSAGRHLSTSDTILGTEIYSFGYDDAGQLVSITDVDGRPTTIERTPEGIPAAVVGPDGHRTELEVDSGRLRRIKNPSGDTHVFEYDENGLLVRAMDPRGNASSFAYSSVGRLTRATNRGGGTLALNRTSIGLSDYEVAVTRRETEVTTFRLQRDGTAFLKTVVDPTGAITRIRFGADGLVEGEFPDGTVASYRLGPDPRFGAAAPRVIESSFSSPGGLETRSTVEASATLESPADLSSITGWQEVITVDGRPTTVTYDVATRLSTIVSAEGRRASVRYDAAGRVVEESPLDGSSPVLYDYDTAGRLVSVKQADQTLGLSYDQRGNLVSATDADGNSTTWTHDATGRMLSATLPGGANYEFTLDANGNRTAVMLPDGRVHRLSYDPNDRLAAYTLPGESPLALAFDGLGRREGVTYPDGSTRDDLYVDALLSGSLLPGSSLGVEYAAEAGSGDGSTRQIDRLLRKPDDRPAQGIGLGLDGRVVNSLAMSGPATATVEYARTLPYRAASRRLGSEPAVDFTYDNDNLLTGMGPFTLGRDASTGLLRSISDGTMTKQIVLDGRSDLVERTVSLGADARYALELARDPRARVVNKVETVDGAAVERVYSYDADGQLTQVADGVGVVLESFSYDSNGNRVSHTTAAGTAVATYDAQDRIVARNGLAYGYDENGFLSTRGGDSFDYGVDGVLRSATVDGTAVKYDHDFLGRRVARTDNGGTTAYVYGDLDHPFRVTASIAPGGTVSEYFYDDAGMLFAFRRDDAWYYVGADQVGSPRVVLEGATGTIVKAVDYSVFGEQLSDSNPEFVLPIGYAGGLADPVSDLIRFGLRDYEPVAGRFTARDPLLLASGSPNLYLYVDNDPVNYRDLSGLFLKLGASGYAGFGGGISVTITSKGVGFCAEGGVGVGAGLGLEPFAALPEAGLSAVLAGGLGPAGTGVEVPFDECWASGRPDLRWDGAGGASDQVIGADSAQLGKEVDRLGKGGIIGQGLKGLKGLKFKGLGAEANLSVRGCLPPLTW